MNYLDKLLAAMEIALKEKIPQAFQNIINDPRVLPVLIGFMVVIAGLALLNPPTAVKLMEALEKLFILQLGFDLGSFLIKANNAQDEPGLNSAADSFASFAINLGTLGIGKALQLVGVLSKLPVVLNAVDNNVPILLKLLDAVGNKVEVLIELLEAAGNNAQALLRLLSKVRNPVQLLTLLRKVPNPTTLENLLSIGLRPNYLRGLSAEEIRNVTNALERWNLDASGKNQGVTHILEYAQGLGGTDKMRRLSQLAEYTKTGPFDINDPQLIPKVTETLERLISNSSERRISNIDINKEIYFIAADGAIPPFSQRQKGIGIITYNGKYSSFVPTSYKEFKKIN